MSTAQTDSIRSLAGASSSGLTATQAHTTAPLASPTLSLKRDCITYGGPTGSFHGGTTKKREKDGGPMGQEEATNVGNGEDEGDNDDDNDER